MECLVHEQTPLCVDLVPNSRTRKRNERASNRLTPLGCPEGHHPAADFWQPATGSREVWQTAGEL
jgi:hypothetical protein